MATTDHMAALKFLQAKEATLRADVGLAKRDEQRAEKALSEAKIKRRDKEAELHSLQHTIASLTPPPSFDEEAANIQALNEF